MLVFTSISSLLLFCLLHQAGKVFLVISAFQYAQVIILLYYLNGTTRMSFYFNLHRTLFL